MKSYLYVIIVLLLVVVGYEGYQIEQLKKMVKKDSISKEEPKVTINLSQKSTPTSVQTKSWMKNNFQNPQQTQNQSNPIQHMAKNNQSIEELQKTIEQDFKKLFNDIFGNKEVKEQLHQSVIEFQNTMNQMMQEIQKQMKDFDANGFFDEFLKDLNPKSFKVFEDKGSYYEFSTPLADKNAKVDVNVKNGYIFIKIKSHIEEKSANQVIKRESQQNYVVKVPKDALVNTIKSEYKNGKLYITIQKAKGVKSI